MQTECAAPADLADVPPGPLLAALLAELDPSGMDGADRLSVMQAWHRQEAHSRAGMYRWMVAVGAESGPVEAARPAPEWSDEIRAALTWTRRAADRRADEALVLVTELPAVLDALGRGEIDLPRASVFVHHLGGLPGPQIQVLCDLVLPTASRRTTSEISRRLRRLIMELDPEHFERRFRKAHAERTVWAWVGEDGAATVSAGGLAPESADAAVERVDRLARRVRRAGHPGTLGRIRADVFVGLLDGTLHGLDEQAIEQVLLVANHGEPGQPSGDAHVPARPTEAGDRRDEPSGGPDPAGAAADTGPVRPSPSAATTSGSLACPRQGVHLQVSLGTLLGLDDRPAVLPGLGPLPASRARLLIAAQRRAPWRFAVTGPDGRVVRTGVLRSRPAGAVLAEVPETDRAAPGLVDLLIDADLLSLLEAEPTTVDPRLPEVARIWRAVVAEVLRARGRPLDDAPGDRSPHTGLRRFVELRDSTCTFVGCLVPARSADLDHTLEYSRGGTTTADDLGPACRHDHGLKDRGWSLTQPEPGHFVWRSPLRREYRTRGEPLLPPMPLPVPHGPDPALEERPAEPGGPLVVWRPDPPPPPAPSPPPVDLDEPPPF